MTPITTKFVHELIEILLELNKKQIKDEELGKETRQFLMNYNHPELAMFWWHEITPSPPKLEDEYMKKVIKYANKKSLDNEEVGKRMRKFTQDFWVKPGHTLVWTPLHGNIA